LRKSQKHQSQGEYYFCYRLFGERTRKSRHAAEAQWIFNQGSDKRTDPGRTAKSAVPGCMNQTTALMKEERQYD
jgi:hypothetical protein